MANRPGLIKVRQDSWDLMKANNELLSKENHHLKAALEGVEEELKHAQSVKIDIF